MKASHFYCSLFFASMFMLSSCGEADDHHHEDENAPVITTTMPTAGDTLLIGNELHINGTVTDEDLHELLITVKMQSGEVLFSATPVVHGLQEYDIHEHWMVSGVQLGDEVQLVIVAADHSENVDSLKQTLHIQ